MGFLSSIFGKRSKQTTDTSGTSNINTQTVRTNPQWVTDLGAQFGGAIQQLGEGDPMDRFAGADPLQDKAYSGAAGLGSFPGYGGGLGAKGAGTSTPVDFLRPAAPTNTMAGVDTFDLGTAVGGPRPTPADAGFTTGKLKGGLSQTAVPGAGSLAEIMAGTASGKVPGGPAGTSPVEPGGATGADPFTDALNVSRSVVGRGPQMFDPSTAKGSTAMEGIEDYIKLFAPNIDAALGDFDKGSGKAAAQLMLNQAGAGAFQNSGGDLERAALASEIGTSRAKLADDLRTGNIRLAAGYDADDANRRQDAGQFNAGAGERAITRDAGAALNIADIASAFGGERRADIGTQAGLGQVYRDIAGGAKNADIDFQAQLQDLFANLPLDLYSGQNTTGTTTTTGNSVTRRKDSGSLADNIGQAIQIAAAAAAFSDREMKHDIVPLYQRPDGLWVYLFSYLGEAARKIGLMAQEVLEVRPEAVSRDPASGFLMVDYSKV